MSPAVIRELAKWKLVSPLNEQDLIFANAAGNPIDGGKLVTRYFKPALKAAELPEIRFHDLRHCHASMLFEQGETITYIQNRLGHSNPAITLFVCAHFIKTENQDAVCKLENTIFKGTGHKMVTNGREAKVLNV